MIIEAKSRKSITEQPEGPEKYAEKPDAKRKSLPVYLALFFTGVLAYLKSAWPAAAPQPVADAGPMRPSNDDGAPVADALPEPQEARDNGEFATDPSQLMFLNPQPWVSKIAYPQGATYGGDGLAPNATLGSLFPAAVNFVRSNDSRPAPPDRGAATEPLLPAAKPDARPRQAPDRPPSAVAVAEDDPSPDADDEADDGPDDDSAGPDEVRDDGPETPPAGNGNRSPVVLRQVRLNDMFAGQVLLLGLAELLRHSQDPDGDTLSVINLAASGGRLIETPAGWKFVAESGALGPVTLTYQITDGEVAVAQTAVFHVLPRQTILTPQDDIFVGTPQDEQIDALEGHDLVDARAGNDTVQGGTGHDHILGGDGDDQLFGGNGDDVLFGQAGHDILDGGTGDDRLFGGDGNDIASGDAGRDTLYGEAGDDILSGGEDADLIEGGEGADRLFGDAGEDILIADAGDDMLSGGTGNDVLAGGDGRDLLDGGEGDDSLAGGAGDDTVLANPGDDQIDGGDGHDLISYAGIAESVTVNFIDGTVEGDQTGSDSFASIEAFIGGTGDDTFIVGAEVVILAGGGGRNVFQFTVTDNAPQISQDLMHEILDFVVDDRIRISNYEISKRAERLEEERFGDIYDSDSDGDGDGDQPLIPQITVRYERYDDADHTIIMADLDNDSVQDVVINVHGYLIPAISEFHTS